MFTQPSLPLRSPEEEERVVRWRRKATLLMSLLMLPYMLEDLYSGGEHKAKLIATKLVWGLVLVACSLPMMKASRRARKGLLWLMTFTSSVAMGVIAYHRGYHHTAYFAWLIALPFCLVMLTRDEVGAAVIAGLGTVGSALMVLQLQAAPVEDQVQWLFCVGSAAGLAFYAAVQQRWNAREAYLRAEEHLAALGKLAHSEKLRSQSERMSLVGQLAAGVAHEINNPLGAVSSNLEFLEGELQFPSVSREDQRLVMLETQVALTRIKGIVRDLTAFCREGVEDATPVDLLRAVTEAEKQCAPQLQGRVGLMNELPEGLRPVMGNQAHLIQVFTNLMVNAAEAVGPERADGKVWIRATAIEDGVLVQVDDNGPGFEEPVLASLFQPFFTTKGPGGGVGMGLATSREYLRRAGGDLLADQRPGGGARFTLALRSAP